MAVIGPGEIRWRQIGRTALHLCAALIAGAWIASAAAQTAYPSRPLRLVSPFPPGGVVDTVSRVVAQKLSESLGQPVVVENKVGAGGNIAAEFVSKAVPDGYTLLMGSIATHAINVSLYSRMPYDAERDFAPVSLAATNTNLVVVNPSFPVRSIAELIVYAKANPGKLNYGTAGSGTAQHLAGELFKTTAGIDMVHVPYKGAAPGISDLLAGQIPLMFVDISISLPHVRAGRLRALAVTAGKRVPQLPEVPAVAESGMLGFEVNAWFGVFVPAGTPREIVNRLNADIVRGLAAPDVRERLLALGVEPVTSTPEQFAAFVKSEIAKWGRIVKISGARAD
jgi:tripartite-type tricarboxylate transporter receptor subunit TctC